MDATYIISTTSANSYAMRLRKVTHAQLVCFVNARCLAWDANGKRVKLNANCTLAQLVRFVRANADDSYATEFNVFNAQTLKRLV